MKTQIVALVGAVALGLSAGFAQAAPVLGAPVLWGGGDLVVTNLNSSSGYTNGIWFDLDGDALAEAGDTFLFFDDAGGTKTIAKSALDPLYNIGDELLFFIKSPDGTFFTGLGSRNPDGRRHAKVEDLGNYSYNVFFEDLRAWKWVCWSCEPDFNDAIFRVDSPVPLPGAVWLFGSALVGLVALNRRRKLSA